MEAIVPRFFPIEVHKQAELQSCQYNMIDITHHGKTSTIRIVLVGSYWRNRFGPEFGPAIF